MPFPTFADFGAARAQYDFFQPPFRGFQFVLAMRLQRLAALIERDGILKIHFALLQPGNNGFQLPERALKAQVFDGLVGPLGIWAGMTGLQLSSRFGRPSRRQDAHNRSYGCSKPASCPRTQGNYSSRSRGNKQFPCNLLSRAVTGAADSRPSAGSSHQGLPQAGWKLGRGWPSGGRSRSDSTRPKTPRLASKPPDISSSRPNRPVGRG